VSTGAFDIDAAIRKIPDHPHPGILFYDLMPLFQSPGGLTACVDRMAAWGRERQPELVLAPEARGLILGGALAQALGVGVTAARKPGKLPSQTVAEAYSLEYGTDALEVHADAVRPRQKVLVHDDLLATGGTALALCNLVERLGGVVVGVAVVVELTFLPGRERLRGYDVLSLVTYDSEAA
jgi:adenine phosphoribosyltransferase